ncbi:MAG: single-stranded DNA-binding protein [Candidatus Dormibacteraeota bacterium]|nr:single-stranded DNA-binding protein [Candidatus Dormibacteraeota bacterium]
MPSLNKVMLIGRLTRDPEVRFLPSGQQATNFSIATNRYATTEGERREFTDYHNCVAWNQGNRKLAEIIGDRLRKGSLVYLEGRLQTRSWESQTGEKRKATEVVVTDFEFLDTRGGQGGPGSTDAGVAAAGQQPQEPGVRDVDPDEIPF